jgi:pimeloyl-ACP methyl ester carboxylesterase
MPNPPEESQASVQSVEPEHPNNNAPAEQHAVLYKKQADRQAERNTAEVAGQHATGSFTDKKKRKRGEAYGRVRGWKLIPYPRLIAFLAPSAGGHSGRLQRDVWSARSELAGAGHSTIAEAHVRLVRQTRLLRNGTTFERSSRRAAQFAGILRRTHDEVRGTEMAQTSTSEIATFRSETAVLNGIRLHYWLGGNPRGKPVLLWHGFLGTAYSWYKVMPLLVQAGYSVLVPDMRGYGDSDKPLGTAGYDARALAEEFRALVEQIEFGNRQKLILAAHDMGAHPALLWTADHPDEIAGLVYMEVPTMLEEFLSKMIVYTPEAMAKGSMWWWVLPLAPGVPERLIIGREREFLTWFYEGATADRASITEESIAETLRSFNGTEGVLGALGVYRAAFTTIDQTTLLKKSRVQVPILAIGGEKALGAKVAHMVEAVAKNVTGRVIPACGHFIPEEQPAEFMRLFQEFAERVA